MMQINRRKFLKYCIGSAASLGLPLSVVGKLESALAADGAGLPTVVWLAASNCTGCTVSLANRFDGEGPRDIADLLTGTINLAYHPNLMGAAGDLAVQQLRDVTAGAFILVVEGGIPTAFDGYACMLWTANGHDVTAKAAVQELSRKAAGVLCVGTCSSYGGMPSASPNPTGIVSVSELTGLRTVNIPGCPTHPDWIVWTVASLLAGEMPDLDEASRPRALFDRKIHDVCFRKGRGEAKQFGDPVRCLKELGCKGPKTKADCPARKWNSGSNWCLGAGSICIGCTESNFPDEFSPFYKVEYPYHVYEKQSEPPGGDPPDEEPPVQDPVSRLSIRSAEWRRKNDELRVEGDSDAGALVTVSNAETGIVHGVVSAENDGRWRVRVRNVKPAPSRIRATSGKLSRESDVTRR
ncbi:MAG: hydrogenase small subunit [Desulfobacterales bacterium]